MGTPASCQNGRAEFESKEAAKHAYKLFLDFVEEANGGKLDGDFFIYDVSCGDTDIVFSADSGRVQNLEWQLSVIKEFFIELDGIKEFSAGIQVYTEGEFWTK